MKNSFNKPEAYEKYYQDLYREMKFFESLKDIFMLSLVLGFQQRIRLPFEKNGGEPIKEHIFNSDDINIMNIIAIESEKDLKILLNKNKDEKYKMMEEYAHAGIKYLVDNIYVGGVTSIESFISFVCKHSPDSEDKPKTDISTMVSNILADIN